MFRAQPVGNRICAARVRKRYEDERQRRLAIMKPSIDTKPPHSTSLGHMKRNLKRDEVVGQRYDEIERDNIHLLSKMAELANKAKAPEPRSLIEARSNSLPLLKHPPGGPARKREESRVARENLRLLDRLQTVPPVINSKKAEADYLRNLEHVERRCEYPLLLAGVSRASKGRHGGRGSGPGSSLGLSSPGRLAGEERLVSVLTTEMSLGMWPHFVEVVTDGQILRIEAYNLNSKAVSVLVVNEQDHRRLLAIADGDYAKLVEGLRMLGDELTLDPAEALESVLTTEMSLGMWPHFVEVTTNGRVMCISACNVNTKAVSELVVGEQAHRRLLDVAGGDYLKLVEGLRLLGGELDLEPVDEALQTVLSTEMSLGLWPHWVEVATDGKVLRVDVCNLTTKDVAELHVNEQDHRRLLIAAGGDYEKLIEELRISGDELVLEPASCSK